MHTRAVRKELPDGNPRAAHKSRERYLKFIKRTDSQGSPFFDAAAGVSSLSESGVVHEVLVESRLGGVGIAAHPQARYAK